MTAPPPAATPRSPTPPAERLWSIDALRGVMLILMTLTHVPTRFTSPAGQPLGFVSAAEGFVFLSAFMAGLVYTRKERARGEEGMRVAFLQRVVRIYLSQAALLVFLFSAVAAIGVVTEQPAVTNLVSFYLERPFEAVVAALLLLYNPPLLDILPMYILFMLASSLLLSVGLKRGWTGLLAASALLWIGAQFGVGHAAYDGFVALTGFNIPLGETGAFSILAWQMLWMAGLWLGARHATGQPMPRIPTWLVAAAAAVALTGFVWRHAIGQAAFPGREDLNLLFDKWRLGPLRVLDLASLVVLSIRFGPWLQRHVPRWRPLETLGSASLPAFCTHLVVALLALAVLGEPTPSRPWAVDVGLLAVAFAALYAVALVTRAVDRHAAQVREAFHRKRDERAAKRRPLAAARPSASAGARRSPTSRSRNPPR